MGTTSLLHESGPRSLRGTHVLVIEDESTITEFLRVGLSYEGFQVVVARDGQSGLRLAHDQEPALVILDLMLPDLDGLDVCRRLREWNPDVPIIILTARGEVADRITGLDTGADDYITKPFIFEELLARIRAVFRRRGKIQEPITLRAAGLILNIETHEVTRDGIPLNLTPTEFSLLELFMRHPRRVFTRETLRNRTWGVGYSVDTNVVDVHIHHLRGKFGDEGRQFIRTIYGIGYSFRPDGDHAQPLE